MFGRSRLALVVTAVLVGAGWVLVAPASTVVAAPSPGRTERESVTSSVGQSDSDAGGSVVSGNGRYTAFSTASDLSDYYVGSNGSGTHPEIFVHDSATGATVQVSVGLSGSGDANGTPDGYDSFSPSISADGRYVSFVTRTSAAATGGEFISVCDRDPDGNGSFDDVTAPATYPNLRCVVVRVVDAVYTAPVLSADGSRIVWGNYRQDPSAPVAHFVSVASLLINGVLTQPSSGDVHELPESVTINGNAAYQNLTEPTISGDGTHVLYVRTVDGDQASGFSPDFSIRSTQIAADLTFGPTARVDLKPGGGFVGSTADKVTHPTVSADGNVIAFASAPPPASGPKFLNLDLGLDSATSTLAPAGSPSEVYAVTLGATTPSVLVSQAVGVGGNAQPGSGALPALSADGRYIAFVAGRSDMYEGTSSAATGLCLAVQDIAAAVNVDCQVVARDLVFDEQRARAGDPYQPAQLVSRSRLTNCAVGLPADAVCAAAGDSQFPSLSMDGKRIAFDSTANDIVAGDTNNVQDTFLHTWTPPVTGGPVDLGTVRVGQQANPVSYNIDVGGFGPISIDSVVVNGPDAGDFSIDSSGCSVILHEGDTCTATLYFRPLDPAGPKTGTINVYADGNGSTPVLSAPVTGTATNVLPSDVGPIDIVRGSVATGDPGGQATHGTMGESMVSSNGRYDIFVSQDNLGGIDNAGRNNIFVRDLRTNETTQVSRGAGTSFGGTANSAAPVNSNGTAPDANNAVPSISGDGRFVSFVTRATNVVNGTAAISAPYVRSVVVLCDRGAPNVQGAFTQAQRCFNLDEEPNRGSSDQQPRLAPDGRHIVFVGCNDPVYFGCNESQRVTLVRIAIDSGTGLAGVFDRTGVPSTVAGFNDPPSVTQYQPQVSREGLRNLGPHGVRVVFGANAGLTAIIAADVRGDAGVAPTVVSQTRLDRDPTTSKYLGDNDTALVGDPSMSDDGTKVVWDYTYTSGGTAQSYVTTVAGSGIGPVTVSTMDVSRYRNSNLRVRAADPALSGDGRYVSYVTDAPSFDGNVPAIPEYTCLNRPDGGGANLTQGLCQVVSRDLVVDATRRAAGQDPLPDALVTASAAVPTCSSPPTAFGSTCGGNDDSIQPSMDRTGLHVGFDSYANDFVANDTNITDASGDHVSAQDAFVRTFRPQAKLTAVSFGSVKLGLAVSRSATLTVVGFGPFVLDGSTVGGSNPGDFSLADGTCAGQPDQALHFDQTCTIMITFTPSKLGSRSGTVTVRGQDNPGAIVTVTGTGSRRPPVPTGPAQFGGTPNPVNFGSDIPLRNPGQTKNVTVTNAGAQALTLTSVDVIDSSVPGARGDYVVDTSGCGAVIAEGTSCVVVVAWSGRAAGPRDALLRFVDNAPGGVQLIGLRANVPTPLASADPGVSPAGRVTTVTGSGFAPKRTVTVVLQDGPEQTSVKTDSKGRFTASLVIFHNTVVGPRIMIASVDGASASLRAGAPMLIVLGTVQSPDFKLRH